MRNAVDALDVSPDQKNRHPHKGQREIRRQAKSRAAEDDGPLLAVERMVRILVNQTVAIVVFVVNQFLVKALDGPLPIGQPRPDGRRGGPPALVPVPIPLPLDQHLCRGLLHDRSKSGHHFLTAPRVLVDTLAVNRHKMITDLQSQTGTQSLLSYGGDAHHFVRGPAKLQAR